MSFKNITTISAAFLAMLSINLFASDPCKGMFGSEGAEEESKQKFTIQKSQKEWEETKATGKNDTSSLRPVQEDSLFGILSDDTLLYIFSLFRVEDLGIVSQVFSQWHRVCSISRLWEKMGFENYRDYFTRADFEEKPKEKIIHHYLSVRLNVLDAEEKASLSKNFKEKYGLTSFTSYFKAYLPSAVKKEHELSCAEIYGKFELLQDIETKKEIKKLRRERDNFIKLAKSEATTEESDGSWYLNSYYSDYGRIPNASSYAKHYRCKITIPKKSHLLTAREINEKLIDLGDAEAARMKKEQLTQPYSQFVAPSNFYQTNPAEWDNFVKNSVDELCSKGYLFAFEWKINRLLVKDENGTAFIESMLQNENPIIRNMGHYVRVFSLKHGKLGYEKDHDKAIEYIKLYKIPY